MHHVHCQAISQEMEEVEAELAANPEDEQEIMRLSNRRTAHSAFSKPVLSAPSSIEGLYGSN